MNEQKSPEPPPSQHHRILLDAKESSWLPASHQYENDLATFQWDRTNS